ncbi:MAG: polyphenol oxidase family protein [Flaviflexus sp.]|nr:polyphenol oxidase family protein [Flaviflexus sp.]
MPGISAPPYDEANLGPHVGDDPRAVAANRAALEPVFGRISWLTQAHGDEIVLADPSREPEADGLIIAPGQAGAVMVADCAPVLMAGGEGGNRLGAAVHAGRPGMMRGIAAKAARLLIAAGIDPATITCVIGPTVCGQCYEVPEDMAAEADRRYPGCRVLTRWGTPGIDIRAGIVAQLAPLGVTITQVDACTMEDDRFFSHRGSGGRTGRCAGVLAIPRHSEKVRARSNASAIPSR